MNSALQRRAAGLFLLLLLAAHAVLKARMGLLPEVMWTCHLASGLLGLGLLLELPALSSAGFLFHLAAALPAYGLHLLNRGETNWSSAALHLLSPLLGWLAWRRRPLPAAAPWMAWAFYIAVLLASRAFTPESLNVNLAFRPWEPWSFLGAPLSHALNLLLMLGELHAVHWLLGRRFKLDAEVAHG